MQHHGVLAVGVSSVILAACASSAKNINTAYVSPLQYQHYDCNQISMESQRVSARAATLAGDIDDDATGDAVAMGVGLVLFWPALFFIDGDGPEATEYSRLKGEYVALEQASIEKNCGLKFEEVKEPPPSETKSASQKFGQPFFANPVPPASVPPTQ